VASVCPACSGDAACLCALAGALPRRHSPPTTLCARAALTFAPPPPPPPSYWFWATISLSEKELLATAGMDALVSSDGRPGAGGAAPQALTGARGQLPRPGQALLPGVCHQGRARGLAALRLQGPDASAAPAIPFVLPHPATQMFERLIVLGLQLFTPITILSMSIREWTWSPAACRCVAPSFTHPLRVPDPFLVSAHAACYAWPQQQAHCSLVSQGAAPQCCPFIPVFSCADLPPIPRSPPFMCPVLPIHAGSSYLEDTLRNSTEVASNLMRLTMSNM
jgi:hypothetical protein